MQKTQTKCEVECKAAINWLYNNKVIVKTDKFRVVPLDKSRSDDAGTEVETGNEKIKFSSWGSY